MLDTWRQILRGTTFYYKQLNLFLALVLIFGAGFWTYKNVIIPVEHPPQAATDVPKSLVPTQDTTSATYNVNITNDGTVTVNGKTVSGVFTYEKQDRQFLLVIVRDSPAFIESLNAFVRFPKPLASVSQVSPRIFAIHGVAASSFQEIDPQTILFSAQEIPDGATVSIGLTFPNNYFQDPLSVQLQQAVATFKPSVWFIVGITLPALTALFLALLVVIRALSLLRVRTSQVNTEPPPGLSPAMIGGLYHGRIARKEITATLFDLANRGFLQMYQGNDNAISFSKGEGLFSQSTKTLRPYEIFLLHQIFGDAGVVARDVMIEENLNQELFSSKISMAMVNIYDSLIGAGFFVESPNRVYLKYRIIGMTLFFIAAGAAIYGAFTLPDPAYILFSWVGMIIASLLIVWITPGLPHRTKLGDTTLRQWLAFRNYLMSHDPIQNAKPDQFFVYLPYAIVLDCEDAWIARWRNEVLTLPKWFASVNAPGTADEYASSLVDVIDYLSKNFLTSRPPTLA